MIYQLEGISHPNRNWSVDMHNVYLQTLHSRQRMPEFMNVYDEYKMKAMEKQIGQELNRALHLNHEEVEIHDEFAVFEYYLERHYFIQLEKPYNPPIKGVW